MKNKIIVKNNYILKYHHTKKRYNIEKNFYLMTKNENIIFIPKMIGFSDKQKLLILENCGKNVKKDELDLDHIKKLYEDLLWKTGFFHNDIRLKNVLKKKNDWYLIDFEYAQKYYDDFRKKSKRQMLFS